MAIKNTLPALGRIGITLIAAAGALASSFSRVRRYSRETVARSRGLVSGSRKTASRRSLSASRRAVVVGSVMWVIRGSR